MQEAPEYCKICGAQKQWKDGGTRADGTTWDGFMACPNWKAHPPQPDRGGFRRAVPPATPSPAPANTGYEILLTEIQQGFKEINDRFDSLGRYLSEKELKDKKDE